ncbi:pilus assembly protein [candidate division FCPU426 bacterium]|nr:pilus assembly protein [candidate division FCPU426 bacterium]
MKRLLWSCHGQSFVELALVIFLFLLFMTGLLQVVMIGSAQIKCQLAARRVAWHKSVFHHDQWDSQQWEIQSLLPAVDTSHPAPGGRDQGRLVKVTCTVPAVGFFRLLKPAGFTISAASAVIAYTQKPSAARLVDQGVNAVRDFFARLGL